MQKHLLSLVAGLSLLAGSSVNASPILSMFGSEPGPSITSDMGWDGGYLNLTQEVNSQSNQAAFPTLVTGSYTELKIDFDFRISEGNGGGADGMGIAYVPTSQYGNEGAVTLDAAAEEPNLSGSFGVGFDTFNNEDQGDGGDSSVSVHWDGNRLVSFPLDDSPIGIFENGEVHHAEIRIVPNGTGSNVWVEISEVSEATGSSVMAVDGLFVEGLQPYDGRMVFSARTGGANSQQDVDNLQLMHMTSGNSPMTTVLYTFVPEPSSMSLLGLGLLCGMGARRRR